MYLLETFGGLTLRSAETGEPIGATRRKPLALLALLAVPDAYVPEHVGDSPDPIGSPGLARERIASLVWPELDVIRARRVLAQTLYVLRRELGADAIVGTTRLTLDPSIVATDVSAFTRQLAVARQAHDDRAAQIALLVAAECYRGPFLDAVQFAGCAEFARWADSVRGWLERAHRGLLRDLAAVATRLGDHGAAARCLEGAVVTYPLDSDLALALADHYVLHDRPAHALDALRVHERALGEALGVGLPAPLRALSAVLSLEGGTADSIHHVATAFPAADDTARLVRASQMLAPPTRRRPWWRRRRSWALAAMAAIGWVVYRGLAEDPRTFEEAMWRRQIGLPWGGIGWPRKHYHGTLLFATPVNTSGNGALDSLGGRLADLVAEANRRRTPDSLVPREQVVRAEASLRAASGGIGMNNVSLAKWLKPGLLVTSSYSLAGDTLVVTANALYERPEPNGPLVRALGHRFRRGWLGAVVAHLDRPTLMWRGLGGLMMGFGYAGWTGSPHDVQAVADSITVRLQTEMVMMSTCDPVAHERRSILSPVCWRKPNVVGEVSTRFGEAPVNDAALRAIMARRLRVFARADSLRRAREGTAARRAGTVMGATEVR